LGAASLRFSGCGFSRISSSSLKQLWVGHVFFRFGISGLQELIEAEEFAAEGAGVGGPLRFAGIEGEGGSELGDTVLGFRGSIGRLAKKLHKAVAFCIPGALLEKCGGGFHDANLFGDGCSNPLVQGNAVFLREALGSFFDRMGQLQGIGSPAHGFILFKKSAGVSTGTPKRAAAAEKSALL